MTTLIVGASGATGKQLVDQILNRKQKIKVIVRSLANLPETWKNNVLVTIIHASVLDISDDEMAEYVKDCDAVVSCLGHNLNLKGIYGHPRMLVTDAVQRLTSAVKVNKPVKPVKFILMNTTGNRNLDLDEPISFGQKLVIGIIRLLLPPQVDNEKAANYLRTNIGQNDPVLEWVAVRPDNLINEELVTEYNIFPSPTRSAVFNPGKTSRINVGHFMASLISNDDIWEKWKGQMPVVYNSTIQKKS